ncbi:PAS domain-containing sensor histidine kinase [Niallia nealsonii]|uniref:histidine kinase n=1 Tax=Niallia nealsonii TaxID=115979 RepID=A0A2N0Z166_9BACI|nr:PAS domain-containing sensor histidine kinase [Niallia nealsonii]PKG23256.1 PAS domain-containing sensor histidine kinase [Niallia nealsonii]
MTGVSYIEELQQLQRKLSDLEQENLYLRNALTEEKQLDKRIKAAFFAAKDGILILHPSGVILDVNDMICTAFRLDKDKIIGRNITHFLPREYREKAREYLVEINESKKHSRYLFPLKYQQNEVFYEISAGKLPDEDAFVAIVRNVTSYFLEHQKKQKEKLLYNEFFTEALDGIVLWKETGEIIAANESALRIFESTYEELMQTKISDYVYQKDEKYVSMIKQLYKHKSNREELMFLMPNGQKKLLEFTTKLHSVEGMHMSIFRNTSERYKMEMDLRESKTMLKNVFEEAFDGIIVWDEAFRIVDMNRAAERILLRPKEEMTDMSLLDVLPNGKSVAEDIKPMLLTLKDGEQNRGLYTAAINQNEWSQFEFKNKYNIYSGLSITTLRDITENAVLEEQLRKSSTLNVIGELAAGIAHEIRNPMTALKGFIQLLENESKSDKHKMYFSVIKTELNRIEMIINEFLLLAKPKDVQYIKCDVTKIMDETLELLQAQAVLFSVQIEKKYQKSQLEIYCDPNQMKKVFINIVKNGIEVLENGGQIQVELTETEDSCHIMIQDNGNGISKELVARLGEPFFTTKEKGTGLGLMVCKRIIEDHKGKMEIESEEGVGTAFHIYIPKHNGSNNS